MTSATVCDIIGRRVPYPNAPRYYTIVPYGLSRLIFKKIAQNLRFPKDLFCTVCHIVFYPLMWYYNTCKEEKNKSKQPKKIKKVLDILLPKVYNKEKVKER